MAISRMQMDRQLYEGGGIITLTPRSKYGLGSKLKKFVRKIIPNEVSEIAVKAAPFVAPFNPLLAGAMSGIGSFDQTGSLTKGLTRGALTYGGGQLARYLGGAGFQEGINPFAGADFSGGFLSGIQSLGTSPIGTETGLRLGQYKMFGGTPTQQVVSSGQPPQVISDTAFDLSTLEPSVVKSTGDVITQTTTPKYTDLFKQVLSGDAQQKTQALKQLGGKALKDIYTNPVRDASGKVIDTQVDKLAIGATIAGATSYLEAKKLAEEAGIVDEGSEYTPEMYESDKSRYSDYYSKILTPASFGLKDGGRIGFSKGLSGNRVAQLLDILEGTKDPDDIIMIQNEIDKLLGKYATGGRVGFKDGPKKEGIVSINPMQDDLEEYLGPGAGIMAPGLSKIMSKGIPTFTSAEKTLVIRNLAGRGKGTSAYKELGVTIPEAKAIMDNPAANLKDATILKEFIKAVMGKKEGGRIGFEGGGINIGIGTFYPERVKEILSNAGESIKSNPELIPSPYLNMSQLEKLKDIKGGVADVYKNIKGDQSGVVQGFKDETRKYKLFFSLPSEDKKKMRELGMEMLDVEEYLDMKNSKVGKKDGGRMGFMMGSEVPLRQNQAGVNEMDYRNTGGFVPPIGVKERADDIPAMLSNNEFVFTADAVRAAGGGSVNKGAQKMYALMKQLEGKVV